MDEANEECVDIAERLGVRDVSLIKTPLHFKILRYLQEYIITRVCEDKAGVNNPDSISFDKYFALGEYHRRRASQLRSEITREMVIGNVSSQRDRARNTATIFRG
jgi:hypothetical protein